MVALRVICVVVGVLANFVVFAVGWFCCGDLDSYWCLGGVVLLCMGVG